ncbi:hypothetical protein C5533_08240, partial [Campylobacter coli]|nr:hypothetical protein [Campylobacter coli]
MKTGSTSIQEFLSVNQDKLFKHGAYFPVKIFGKNQRSFCFCFYKENRKDAYAKILKNKCKINDLMQFRKSLFYTLEQEIPKLKFNKFIISAEGFSLDLDYDEIVHMRKYLEKLFDEIKIVCYLREKSAYIQSLYSQSVKGGISKNIWSYCELFTKDVTIDNLKNYTKIFGKENIIVKIFDKKEFYKEDLLKDFIHNIGLEWDDDFIIPKNENESLNLLGMELLKALNKKGMNSELRSIMENFFSNNQQEKFLLPIDLYIKMSYSKESNEWVRKEFFPHKERLFPKKDLTNYKENYELKEMKPEYWDRIAEFIADIVKTKNQAIQNKDNQIISTNNEKQKLIDEKSNLQTQINQLQNTLNALPIKKQQLEISNLEQDLINKKLNAKETNQNILIKELEIKKLEQELNINQAFSYIPKEQ